MPTSTDTTATAVTDEAVEALKPCPFCGWKASIVRGGPGNHFIQCTGCRATSDDKLLESAIAAWNRRATLPHIRQAAEPAVTKPLEWRPGSLPDRYNAAVFGRPMYEVGRCGDGKWYWLHNWYGLAKAFVSNEEAAKAAAQADYEARIRSALASPAQQEPVAWQWLHHHSFTGTPMWMDTDTWMGRKSEVKRPLYAAPTPPASPAPDMREVVEALEFYADEANWLDGKFIHDEPGSLTLDPNSVDKDHGSRARVALARLHTRGDASHG